MGPQNYAALYYTASCIFTGISNVTADDRDSIMHAVAISIKRRLIKYRGTSSLSVFVYEEPVLLLLLLGLVLKLTFKST